MRGVEVTDDLSMGSSLLYLLQLCLSGSGKVVGHRPLNIHEPPVIRLNIDVLGITYREYGTCPWLWA
jgi:hypothetical protein